MDAIPLQLVPRFLTDADWALLAQRRQLEVSGPSPDSSASLTSTPTPRLWLGGDSDSTEHFVHESLIDYLLDFMPNYNFRRPFVNAALRYVDALHESVAMLGASDRSTAWQGRLELVALATQSLLRAKAEVEVEHLKQDVDEKHRFKA